MVLVLGDERARGATKHLIFFDVNPVVFPLVVLSRRNVVALLTFVEFHFTVRVYLW
jgi:hypothetical protein